MKRWLTPVPCRDAQEIVAMRHVNCVWKEVAGPRGIAVGTANFINPETGRELVEGLGEALRKLGCGSLRDLVGTLDVT
jgi:hypothetical protein